MLHRVKKAPSKVEIAPTGVNFTTVDPATPGVLQITVRAGEPNVFYPPAYDVPIVWRSGLESYAGVFGPTYDPVGDTFAVDGTDLPETFVPADTDVSNQLVTTATSL